MKEIKEIKEIMKEKKCHIGTCDKKADGILTHKGFTYFFCKEHLEEAKNILSENFTQNGDIITVKDKQYKVK